MSDTKNLPTSAVESAMPAAVGVFGSMNNFVEAQRMVNALAASDIVPENYKGNVANCLVALEMSQRTGAGIMAVMQNLHIISGRPSWSSSFIIAALNSCGLFSPIRYEIEELGEKTMDYTFWDGPKGQRQKKSGKITIPSIRCRAWAYDRATNDRLDGPWVSTEMAVQEGWWTKNDSKWPTMTDLMLRYRAAAFFGRLYAPHVTMGMHGDDEVADIEPRDITPPKPANQNAASSLNDELGSGAFGGGQTAAPEAPQAAQPGVSPRQRASRKAAAAAAPAGDVIEGSATTVDEDHQPAPEAPAQEQAPQTQQTGSAGPQLW